MNGRAAATRGSFSLSWQRRAFVSLSLSTLEVTIFRTLMYPLLALTLVVATVAANTLLAEEGDHCNMKVCASGPGGTGGCSTATGGPRTHCLQSGNNCAWDGCDAT